MLLEIKNNYTFGHDEEPGLYLDVRYARLRQEMTRTLGTGVVLEMEIMVRAPGI